MYGHADYYDVQIPSGEGFVVVVGSNIIKDPAGRVFTYSRAVNEATKQKQACQSKCEVYVRMHDLRVDGKLIKSSSSSSSSSAATSSATSSVASVSTITMGAPTFRENGEPLPREELCCYEAKVTLINESVKIFAVESKLDVVTFTLPVAENQVKSIEVAAIDTDKTYSKFVIVM